MRVLFKEVSCSITATNAANHHGAVWTHSLGSNDATVAIGVGAWGAKPERKTKVWTTVPTVMSVMMSVLRRGWCCDRHPNAATANSNVAREPVPSTPMSGTVGPCAKAAPGRAVAAAMPRTLMNSAYRL